LCLARARRIVRSHSDSSISRLSGTISQASYASSIAGLCSLENELDTDSDREVFRLGETSGSLPDPLGDLLRPSNRRVLDFGLEDRVPSRVSSSILEMLVAAVRVEVERCEKRVKLPSELLCAETDEREAEDLDRREPLMDPPKISPRPLPGKALKRLREIASSPKIATRERLLAVGVEGTEFLPVRNLNRPY
jgi:hypothetical protein